MINTLKRPPEAKGTVEEQLEDIRTYLNIIYRKLMTDNNGSLNVFKELFQSCKGNGSKEIANLFSETIRAEKIVVQNDLTDGKTIIDGGTIQTGTIDANKVNVKNVKAEKIEIKNSDGEVIFYADVNALQARMGNLLATKDGFRAGSDSTHARLVCELDTDNPTPDMEFSIYTGSQNSPYIKATALNGIGRIEIHNAVVDAYRDTEAENVDISDWLNELEARIANLE